jgi:ferredoxin-nitrite reductase
MLFRLRIPGGLLSSRQCEVIAHLADQTGGSFIQLTNRANIQLRGIQAQLAPEILQQLQALGLASPFAEVDAIRNIMGSPTAGIDPQALLDTRPLVQGWNDYLNIHPDLAVLSPKFSVCFDGGETVSVRDRPNDITLVATPRDDAVVFRLHLGAGDRGTSPQDTGAIIKSEDSINCLAALAAVYRDYTVAQRGQTGQPPRLRSLLQGWGVETYLQQVENRLSKSLCRGEKFGATLPASPRAHLGLHAQRQAGLFYLGVGLSLGRLQVAQLRGLAALSAQYSSTLRLTPWQTILIPGIPQQNVNEVQQQVESLGLYPTATHPSSAMVACSGTAGCRAAATDTQGHALALMAHLVRCDLLDVPLNVHFSGCDKSCAQPQAGDITLVGVEPDAYRVYVGNRTFPFGQELYAIAPAEQLPTQIESMLRVYQRHRQSATEGFGAFTNRYAIAELQQLFAQC